MSYNDLVVVVPTRGRPQNAKRLSDVFLDSYASVFFVVDDNDPEIEGYAELGDSVLVVPHGRPGIVDPLNRAVDLILRDSDPKYIGFLGDDHLPRTPDWDVRIIEALDQLGTGFVYGNDLLMGEALPTGVFMTTDIPRALGYMAPPILRHLYVDNVWLDWGREIGIKYLDDVIIEHIHPNNGTAQWDDTYERCNSPAVTLDKTSYDSYKSFRLPFDLTKLRALLHSKNEKITPGS